MAKTTEEELKHMQAEVARLQTELGMSEEKRSAAESEAKAIAQASQFTSKSDEQATGKTVMIKVCLNPHVRDAKEHKFKEVEFPTYFYKINLPVGAGIDLTTNGIAYYHGQTYEFDPFTLVDIKSREARTWDHEKSIHGDSENAYKKKSFTL